MTKKISNTYLFVAVIFSMLFFLSIVNGQTTSVNLEGTSWIAKPSKMVNVDASITVITFTYFFNENGKVKLYTFLTKGSGISPVTGQMTFPSASSTETLGTYKVSGKSVYLNFPNETIKATINGNVMKGTTTLKKNNQKEEWIVERELNKGNRKSPPPNTVRNSNGTLRPADGYRWLNSKDPNDFRVERIP